MTNHSSLTVAFQQNSELTILIRFQLITFQTKTPFFIIEKKLKVVKVGAIVHNEKDQVKTVPRNIFKFLKMLF